MQKTHSLSFLEHWLEYLLLLAAVAGVAYFLVQWALPNIASYVAQHMLLVSALSVVLLLGCTAHKTVPALWRGYRAIHNHKIENRERDAYISLLEAAKTQMQEGFNVNLKNSKTGDELAVLNPYVQGRGAGHVSIHEIEQMLDKRLAIAAPKEEESEQIPDIVNYKDIAREVPSDLSLLGIYPENGNLEIVDPEKYKTVWFVGGSNTGKTNTVYGKVADAVRWGAKLVICDKHGAGNKPDSLTNQLSDFRPYLLDRVAVSPTEIKVSIVKFMREFKKRSVDSTYSWTDRWLIVVDEVNATAEIPVRVDEVECKMLYEEFGIKTKPDEFVKLKVFIEALARLCGFEGRGYGMYGYFISQKAAGLAWLRNCAMTVFCHAMLMDSEALIAANQDRKMADLVKQFKKGRTLVYGYEIEQPVILQQPLYNPQKPLPPVVEADSFYDVPTTPLNVFRSAENFDISQHNGFHISEVNTGNLVESGKWLDERVPILPVLPEKLPETDEIGQDGKAKEYRFTDAEKPILVNLYNKFHSIEECLKTMKKGARYHKDASRLLKDAGLVQ
jgi:hypothetical protein